MNRFTTEFEYGILGFYFIYLSSTRVSDFMVILRRLIRVRVVSASMEMVLIGVRFVLIFHVCIYKYLLCVCV